MLPLLLALLPSCVWYAPSDPPDTDPQVVDDDDDGCGVVLVDTRPRPSEGSAAPDDPIVAEFSEEDDRARIYLSAEGRPVAGELRREEQGQVLIFWPDAPLAPGIAHEALITWCAGEARIDFRVDGERPPAQDTGTQDPDAP